jgi:hypothetical protein|tara:strand:- start:8610 stop:8870 length:261 start_codon:yes stop_codon:yes gene_type:complete
VALSKTTKDKLRKKASGNKFTPSQLERVYKRGLGAYSSGGSRKGMTAHQWAMARVNSFVSGKGGARKADKDIATGKKKKPTTKRKK